MEIEDALQNIVVGLGVMLLAVIGFFSLFGLLACLEHDGPSISIVGPAILICLCVLGVLLVVIASRQKALYYNQREIIGLLDRLLSRSVPPEPRPPSPPVAEVVPRRPPGLR